MILEKLHKYPSTRHLPWSKSISREDKIISSLSAFQNEHVIVTEKMDGENTSLYTDSVHSRSLDWSRHPSRFWVKDFWSKFRFEIPKNWRICGENLFTEHSIHYIDLLSYFYGFSIWDETNTCLSWDDTCEWFSLLGIRSVPVIYSGQCDFDEIHRLWKSYDENSHEGYVVRLSRAFHFSEFELSVGKYVRENHVQTPRHWLSDPSRRQNLLHS